MADKTVLRVTLDQIESARMLIRLVGEDNVDPLVVRIANTTSWLDRVIIGEPWRRQAS